MHQAPTYLYLHLSKQLLKLWDKYVTELQAWSIPRACKAFSLRAVLVERFTWAQKQPSERVKYKGWSRIHGFRQNDRKWVRRFGPENWPQNPKERYKTWRRNSCYDQIRRNAHLFSQWSLIYKSDVHFQHFQAINIRDCPTSVWSFYRCLRKSTLRQEEHLLHTGT